MNQQFGHRYQTPVSRRSFILILMLLFSAVLLMVTGGFVAAAYDGDLQAFFSGGYSPSPSPGVWTGFSLAGVLLLLIAISLFVDSGLRKRIQALEAQHQERESEDKFHKFANELQDTMKRELRGIVEEVRKDTEEE